MNAKDVLKTIGTIDNWGIPCIDDNVNFWMIRSKAGFFYDEFVKGKYVALAWNHINQKTVINADTTEILKDEIKERYGISSPTQAINKCKRFIYEMKEGDYVVVPGEKTKRIAICKVGAYFEEGKYDYKDELTVIHKIDNKEAEIKEIECPFIKRRRIEVLAEVDVARVNYKFLRALSSYHGLNSLNEYASDILSSVYHCFIYNEDMYCTVNVAKNEPIGILEMADLMHYSGRILAHVIDEEDISTAVNLNSPGKILIRMKKIFNKVKNSAGFFLFVYIVVTGGTFGPIQLPGAVETVQKILTFNQSIEKEQLDVEKQEIEIDREILKLIQELKGQDIQSEDILEDIKELDKLREKMKFQSNEEFARDVDSKE